MKILIFLKKNQTSGGSYGILAKSGLFNSASFLKNAFKEFFNIESELRIVVDSNSIDREVHLYKPTHVILEALFAPPYKVKELGKLYPHIKWIVRVHSKTPFLANEGIAIKWLKELKELHKENKNILIGFNAKETYEEFKELGYHPVYLPNFYTPNHEHVLDIDHPSFHAHHAVHIGCFGAIRPMKNQLIQAMAAIEYANSVKKKLYFHINGDRVEQKGEQVLKNIENLFENSSHELVKWPWMTHEEFTSLIRRMDFGLQVSLSESFNIVAADFVHVDVPIITSDEVEWMPGITKAKSGSANSILYKLKLVSKLRDIVTIWSTFCLFSYNVKAYYAWKKFFKKEKDEC